MLTKKQKAALTIGPLVRTELTAETARANGKSGGRPRLPISQLSPSSIRSRRCRAKNQ